MTPTEGQHKAESIFGGQWCTNDCVNEFISGAVGGLAGLIIGHPMDTVKIIMQNSTEKPNTLGVIHAVRQAGLTSFFKGLSIPLYSYGLVNAVTFGTYKCCLKRFDPTERSPIACLSAGAIAACVQLIPAVPVELIKVQQQNTACCAKPAPSALYCARIIVRQRGFRGLYTGTIAHAFRDVPGLAVYFLVYNTLLPVPRKFGLTTFWSAYISGAVSGALSWIVSIPFDVVKTRMQSGNLDSLKNVVRSMIQAGNYHEFFRGFNVVLCRALLVNSSIFAVYELCYAWLNKQNHSALYNRAGDHTIMIID